jgi:hypothetical protein
MRPTDGNQPHESGRQLDEATTPAGPDVRQVRPAHQLQRSEMAEPTPQAEPKPRRRSLLSRTIGACRPYIFKRSNVTQWLLAVFLLTIIGAFLLYPRRAPVYRPPPLNIEVTLLHGTAVSQVTMDVSSASPNAVAMTLQLDFSRARSGTTSAWPAATMNMPLPAGVIPESCHSDYNGMAVPSHPGQCSYLSNNYNGGLGLSLVAQTKQARPSPTDYWTATFKLRLRGQGPWNANGLTIEAQLPVLRVATTPNRVSPATPLPLNNNPPTHILYWVPDAISYDWSGGLPPNEVSISPAFARWDETLQSLAVPIAVGGTDSSSASLDSLRTFAAGTLLGIAGGAFVGAIQEFPKRKKETPTPLARSLP